MAIDSNNPNKVYTIGEVAKALGLEPYTIRFWEQKFPSLRPSRIISGRRYYSNSDIDAIIKIKDMLYSEGYSIRGLQNLLKNHGRDATFKEDTQEKSELRPHRAESNNFSVNAQELIAKIEEIERDIDLILKDIHQTAL